MSWTALPSGSLNEANRANPSTSPRCSSNGAPRPASSPRLHRAPFDGPVQGQPYRAGVELGPVRPVATEEAQPHHVPVELHGPIHVGHPVVHVVEEHLRPPPGPRRTPLPPPTSRGRLATTGPRPRRRPRPGAPPPPRGAGGRTPARGPARSPRTGTPGPARRRRR